ncbi:MAG: hypothetical protein ACK4G1_07900, partial [Ignavibacteria bacterium]
TVIEAIADGKKAAEAIINKEKIQIDFELKKNYKNEMIEKAYETRKVEFSLSFDSQELANRCLLCDVVCNKCVDVCPNRANIALKINDGEFKDQYQIIHLDAICNECGNCETFCPYSGKPYKNKFTIFSDVEEFSKSQNPGFVFSDENILLLRLSNGTINKINFQNKNDLVKTIKSLSHSSEEQFKFYSILSSLIKDYSFLIQQSV